jgi:hypothetical protein
MKLLNKAIRVITLCTAGALAVHAQQNPLSSAAYRFETLIPGTPMGDNTFDPDAVVDGTAINDAGEVAFVAHWLDGSVERAAVFTTKRIVASEGELIGGKAISGISAACLTINSAGQVAYEATFTDLSGSQTGVFVEKRFLLALSNGGTAGDFVFTNDGRVLPRPGIAVAAASPVQPTPSLSATPAPQSTPSGSKWHPTLSQKIWDKINKVSPVQIPNDIGSQPQAAPQQQSPPTQNPGEPKSATAMPTAPPVRACNPPAFPFPPEWQLGDDPGGIITSHLVEAPGKTKPYDSPFYGHISAPIRVTQFSEDCRPLLIEISDTSIRGRIEIWSPAGLVTYLQASGFFAFNGIAQHVPTGAFTRAETTIRINKHGQFAIPVSLSPHGSAILIGTPTGR